MIEARSMNVSMLEDLVASWIERTPFQLPSPEQPLRHQLGRWAKVYAIWISRDQPVPAGIDVAVAEYIGQHYGLMLPFKSELSQETDETCFKLATEAGLKIFNGWTPAQALQAVMGEFAADPAAHKRPSNSAPREDWQHYWEIYRNRLI